MRRKMTAKAPITMPAIALGGKEEEEGDGVGELGVAWPFPFTILPQNRLLVHSLWREKIPLT